MLEKFIGKSDYGRNVITLTSGTMISQLIPIVVSPILTRIYSPKDFGIFALYMSITTIILVIASGKYELAIFLPKQDEDAINITILSIILVIIVSLIVCVIILLMNNYISGMLKNPDISIWLYFIPLNIFLGGVFLSINYWSNRKKYYKRLALSRIIQSSTTAAFSVGIGFAIFGPMGLIVGFITGQMAATGFLGWSVWKESRETRRYISREKIITQLKRYIKFPSYLTFSGLLETASSQLPIILLSTFFGSSVAGFISLSQRVIRLPSRLVATSVGDVFRQRASYDFANSTSCRKIFIKTFKRLLFISIFPFVILIIFSPNLFEFVFGRGWRCSGEYTQIMAMMFFLQFIVSPLSSMFIIAEKQRYDLIMQLLLFFFSITALYQGYYIFDNPKAAILLFTIVYTIKYSIQLYYSFKFSEVEKKN